MRQVKVAMACAWALMLLLIGVPGSAQQPDPTAGVDRESIEAGIRRRQRDRGEKLGRQRVDHVDRTVRDPYRAALELRRVRIVGADPDCATQGH